LKQTAPLRIDDERSVPAAVLIPWQVHQTTFVQEST